MGGHFAVSAAGVRCRAGQAAAAAPLNRPWRELLLAPAVPAHRLAGFDRAARLGLQAQSWRQPLAPAARAIRTVSITIASNTCRDMITFTGFDITASTVGP